MVFLVVLYSCERCTIRKAKHWRTDAFELWCWMLVVTLPVNARDMRDAGWIPGSGRSPEGGHGNPFQYSCLQNPHCQRSLAGYSSWSRKVGHDWATKYLAHMAIFKSFFCWCPGPTADEINSYYNVSDLCSHLKCWYIWGRANSNTMVSI